MEVGERGDLRVEGARGEGQARGLEEESLGREVGWVPRVGRLDLSVRRVRFLRFIMWLDESRGSFREAW